MERFGYSLAKVHRQLPFTSEHSVNTKCHIHKAQHAMSDIENHQLLWVGWWPPKDYLHPVSQNRWWDLCGKRDFADVIKLGLLWWDAYPGLPGWALHPITGVLLRVRQREIRQKEEKMSTGARPQEARVRDWRDEATSPGTPGATRIWKRQAGPSLEAFGGSTALPTCRFVLFLASQLVLLCRNSHGKLTQPIVPACWGHVFCYYSQKLPIDANTWLIQHATWQPCLKNKTL